MNEQAVRSLSKHFVSLCWTDPSSTIENVRHQAYSGFVVSIRRRWALVTAGHILGRINRAIDGGQCLAGWTLDDGWTLDGHFDDAIPFDLASAPRIVLGEEAIDYGVIGLAPPFARLLEKNGIEPMDERHWKPKWPEQFDSYVMLGLPTQEIVHAGNGFVQKAVVTLPVTPLANPPDTLVDPKVPRFYGTIELPDDAELHLSDIDGMSGGPVFGFKMVNGESRYWIVGIQSGWLREERAIVACYLEPLLRAFDRAFATD
ncbi:MAG: hypothetical protein ACRERC_27545 [Candidatus Binatia bacterium]